MRLTLLGCCIHPTLQSTLHATLLEVVAKVDDYARFSGLVKHPQRQVREEDRYSLRTSRVACGTRPTYSSDLYQLHSAKPDRPVTCFVLDSYSILAWNPTALL